MFMPFHVLWVEDAISYLPWCVYGFNVDWRGPVTGRSAEQSG
jgi:hypothetical protein